LSQLKVQSKPVNYLDIEFQVRPRSPGMYGSGIFIINPPWNLESQLKTVLPLLVKQLGDEGSQFSMVQKNG
jgi:23S rRNA (adenine2030-N6)-methyltransferase